MTDASDFQLQQYTKEESEREKGKKQDIKNAEYIAHIDKPNHPNT